MGQAADRLAATGLRGRVLRALVPALEDRQTLVREAAAHALGRLGDARAVESLLVAAEDESEGVRLAATKALDRLARAQGIQISVRR